MKRALHSNEPNRSGMGYEYCDYFCPNCNRLICYEPEGYLLDRKSKATYIACQNCGEVVVFGNNTST